MSVRLRIAIAVLCAVLAGAAFITYAGEVRAQAEKVRSDAIARYGGEVVELAVATRTLESGESVGVGDVVMREWLSDLAPDGAISNLDDVIGRVVTHPVAKDMPLTSLTFRDATHAVDVPAGHVAITLPSSEKLGMSSEVEVGSKVVAYTVSDTGVELCALDVVVLSNAASSTSAIGASLPITIAVLPSDVTAILSASSEGSLRLVLPAEDVAQIEDGKSSPEDNDTSVAAVEDTPEEGESNE